MRGNSAEIGWGRTAATEICNQPSHRTTKSFYAMKNATGCSLHPSEFCFSPMSLSVPVAFSSAVACQQFMFVAEFKSALAPQSNKNKSTFPLTGYRHNGFRRTTKTCAMFFQPPGGDTAVIFLPVASSCRMMLLKPEVGVPSYGSLSYDGIRCVCNRR